MSAITGDLDPRVIPMVEYFNQCGLGTWMSCQGHSPLSQNMFWIEFDDDITLKDILEFQSAHLDSAGQYGYNGCFCERVVMYRNGVYRKAWRYVAGNPKAADDDLLRWKAIDEAKNSARKSG